LEVDELCRLLGTHRQRPIRLVPHPLPVPGPYGAWLATETTDYILYQQDTTKSHQGHIILHEIGHMLADHQAEVVPGDGLVAGDDLAPHVATPFAQALHRSSYEDEQEREAELIATIILECASVVDRVAPRSARDPSINRVQEALCGRRGWL
jgi:Zn-dependent peptidase ImmA (M78 family)